MKKVAIAIAVSIFLMMILSGCAGVQKIGTRAEALRQMILDTGRTQDWVVKDRHAKRLDLFHEFENGDWIFIWASVVLEPTEALDIYSRAEWQGEFHIQHYTDIGFTDEADYVTLICDGVDVPLKKEDYQIVYFKALLHTATFIQQGWFEDEPLIKKARWQ